MAPANLLPAIFSFLERREIGGSNMNLDYRSIIWGVFAILYTIATAYGLVRVVLLRHTLAVRLRGLYLIVPSILIIHCYITLILLAYIINGRYPCGVEFWIMNTLLPYGMALVQRMFSCLFMTPMY